MQRMTANRQRIIEYIRENVQEPPAAWAIAYDLKMAKSQVHRTLNDLVDAGILIVESVLQDPIMGQGLPRRVRVYQVAADVESNQLERRISAIVKQIHKARNGVEYFGAVFDKGATPEQIKEMQAELDALRRLVADDLRLADAAAMLAEL